MKRAVLWDSSAVLALLDGRPTPRVLGKKSLAIAALDRLSPALYDGLSFWRMRAHRRSRRGGA